MNGLTHVNGSDEGKIGRPIDKTAKTLSASRVPIRLSQDKDKLVVEAGAAPRGATAKEATLWLAVIAKTVTVPIERGENQGKTVTYSNVVRELIPIGMWNGKADDRAAGATQLHAARNRSLRRDPAAGPCRPDRRRRALAAILDPKW